MRFPAASFRGIAKDGAGSLGRGLARVREMGEMGEMDEVGGVLWCVWGVVRDVEGKRGERDWCGRRVERRVRLGGEEGLMVVLDCCRNRFLMQDVWASGTVQGFLFLSASWLVVVLGRRR